MGQEAFWPPMIFIETRRQCDGCWKQWIMFNHSVRRTLGGASLCPRCEKKVRKEVRCGVALARLPIRRRCDRCHMLQYLIGSVCRTIWGEDLCPQCDERMRRDARRQSEELGK